MPSLDVYTLLTPETVMSAAPVLTCMYSVCVVCQWFCVLNSEPTWKMMTVGEMVGVSREEGGGKENVVAVGGGR